MPTKDHQAPLEPTEDSPAVSSASQTARKSVVIPTPWNWTAINAVSSFLIFCTGVFALVCAGIQIHDYKAEARVQHLMQKASDFESPSFTAKRKALATQRVDKEHERLKALDTDDAPLEMYDALDFCVDLGLLTEHGALNSRDVWSEFSYWLYPMYQDALPLIDAERKKSPASYVECSRLMEMIEPIEKKEDAGSQLHQSEQDIYGYYMGEIDTQPGEPTHRGKKHSGK